MSSEVHPHVIQAESLSKIYRLYERPHHRLLQSLAGDSRRYYREFSALNNVSFELRRGETLGIIGTNGAGKSTLLQLLCGTLQPSAGHVKVQGRIAALLELGAGFNPEFTGRENLTINAAILGLTPRQIDERTEDIIAFADIGDFIDRPVKTYSSGMYVRLAFSVVVHVDPQILIVDEALAVGDALFQFKCMSRMRRMLDDGVSLLFTSHDISAIKALCQRALWLEKGQARMLGVTSEVTRAYDQDWVLRANEAQGQRANPDSTELPTAVTPGTRSVEIIAAHWGADGLLGTQARVQYGDVLVLRVRARVHQSVRQVVLSYHIKNKQNQNVLGGHTACEPELYARHWQAGETFDVAFNIPVQWHAGDYALTLLVASIGDVQHYSDVIFHDWKDQLATVNVLPRSHFPLSDMVEPPSDVSVNAQAPWVIVDDFFPHLLTGFRVAEYNAHLKTFGQLQIMSTLGDFSEQYPHYRKLYPEHARRVSVYSPERLAGAALAYITFLNNAHAYLDDLTRHRVPFVLNLYPGGGLGLGDGQSDQKLLRVLASPLIKDIIVTQPVVERYVTQLALAHGLTLPPMHLVQGVVVNPDYFDPALACHGLRYGQGKDTLDVCFVAESYMPGAANKGFPEFIAAMQCLADLTQLRVHIVGGGYTPADLQAPGLSIPVQYLGRLPTAQLREFYGQMDLIISPNRPGQLHAGNFDGFPTGACVEAALCEVAIMATDALRQNPGYVDQQSILLLDHEGDPLPEQIERAVRHLAAHPEQLSQLAKACQSLTRTLYAPARQIATRQEILRKAAA